MSSLTKVKAVEDIGIAEDILRTIRWLEVEFLEDKPKNPTEEMLNQYMVKRLRKLYDKKVNIALAFLKTVE